MDFIYNPESHTTNKNNQVLSVSEICKKIKHTLTNHIGLVTIIGEISSITKAQSGHIYFTLKDEHSQIKCVFLKNYQISCDISLAQGMQVQVSGQISIFESRGDLQIIIYKILPIGDGQLQLQFENLKKKLLSEGLFDKSHKKSLPKFPKKIAVITSSKSAAIKDFCAVAKARFPLTNICIYNSPVQGVNAALKITNQLLKADQANIYDAIILTRGGGSLDDLWEFNNESLARAIFDCKTPVISAIGHEIDFSITDFVADVRAATPSQAAEILLPDICELSQYCDQICQNIIKQINYIVTYKKHNLAVTQKNLFHPKDRIKLQKEKCLYLTSELHNNINNIIHTKKHLLTEKNITLDLISPKATLKRGYAIIKHQDKLNQQVNIIDSIEKVSTNDNVEITLADGKVNAIIK